MNYPRKHKCESCGRVFTCVLCTDAMVKHDLDNKSQSTLIYHRDHEPSGGIVRKSKFAWECAQCR